MGGGDVAAGSAGRPRTRISHATAGRIRASGGPQARPTRGQGATRGAWQSSAPRRWAVRRGESLAPPRFRRRPGERRAVRLTAIESFAGQPLDRSTARRCHADVEASRRYRADRCARRHGQRSRHGRQARPGGPSLTGRPSVKGGKAWHRFVHLKRLRDDVVHVKERGYSSDPAEPSVYGRLILGEGDECVAEAAALILARPSSTSAPRRSARHLALLDSRQQNSTLASSTGRTTSRYIGPIDRG